MEGHGYYNLHSQQQANAASRAYGLWRQAASEVPLGPVLRIADFGSSQGRNSLEPMRLAVETLRDRRSELEIEITHTDLPQNDFNSLIELVSGPQSYVSTGVYAGARGGTFYGPLFASESLTLGWCSSALHWLSEDTKGSLVSSLLSDPQGKEQARQDWQTWVDCRTRELCPGGQLVLCHGYTGEDGTQGPEPLMNTVWETMRAVLPADEVGTMCLPTYYRTREEWLAPLGRGLEALDVQESVLDDVYWNELQRTGDRAAFAEAVVGAWRAPFHGPLFGDRDVKDLYPRLTAALEADPTRGRCNWRLMLLRLVRR